MDRSAATFSEPPALDSGSLNILQVISRNETHNSKHPLFVFMDANDNIEVINWGQAVKAFNVACHYTLHYVNQGCAPERVNSRVVGIVATLDSITYYSLIVGIMKAGFIPLLISTRNSSASVAHLLNAANCSIIYTSEDSSTKRLADSAISLYESQNPGKERIAQIPAPSFQRLYHSPESDFKEVEPSLSRDMDTPCIIVHSSGTTNFPKLVSITHHMFMEHATTPRLEGHWRGKLTSVHVLPMYHVMGLLAIAFSAVLGGVLSVFRPSQPPILPSPDLVLKEAVSTSSTHIWCVPSFLEAWASNKLSIAKMKRFSCIMYGGGPLQASVGNYLEEQGIRNISPIFGLSEVGPLSTYFPQYGQRERWSGITFNKRIDLKFVKEDDENGTYRLIVMKNAFKTPAVFNTEVAGVPAFDTGDLYTRHPYIPGSWKIYGRADDQIIHSTGEKTNPVPIESSLTRSPYISGALMFGRAQFRPGVLIAPSADHISDYGNAQQRNEYIKLIWSAIEEANRISPQHSRIFEDMIILAHPDRPFEYTAKGTVRRKVTLQKYEKEIESIYTVIEPESPANSDVTAFDVPKITANKRGGLLDPARNSIETFTEVFRIVRDSVTGILGGGVHDEDDIFSAGADSLCAISIRNSLVQKLKSEKLDSSQVVMSLPQDILYVLPSMSKLAAFIYGLIHSDCQRFTSLMPASNTSKLQVTATEKVEEVHVSAQEMMDRKWQSIMESKETVVEIAPVSKAREPPLLLLHGAPGTLETFPMFMQCTTGVWGIQVTDEAPQDSLVDLAQFYYRKIKEKQPSGPYRLAAYSGTIVLLLELVLLFQQSQDHISQFAMLDHFPTYYFPSHDPSSVRLDDPIWVDSHVKKTLFGIMKMVESIPGELGVQAAVRNRDLKNALNGEGVPSKTSLRLIKRTKDLMTMSLEYLLSDRFMVDTTGGNGTQKKTWSAERFGEFVKQLKPTLSMYIAKGGVRYIMAPELMEVDLGARKYFPLAKVYTFDGGHLDFLADKELLRIIQTDWDMWSWFEAEESGDK